MWQVFLPLAIAGLVTGSSTFLPEPNTNLEAGAYNLTYAEHALYFSAAAYCTHEDILSWDCGPPCEFHPGFTAVNVYEYELYGETPLVFTGYSESEMKFVISFQGTQGRDQLWQEIERSSQTAAEIAPGHVYNIEKYFWQAYIGLYNIRQQIQKEVVRADYEDYDFFITGHSLGGGLAAICAMDLVVSGLVAQDKMMLYTMGQPRIGDKEWADAFDKYVTQAYRITHANDIVVHIPPEWELGWKYTHAGQEIWYNEAFTNYTVCEVREDPTCADSVWFYDWSVDDHLNYFNQHVAGMCGKNATMNI